MNTILLGNLIKIRWIAIFGQLVAIIFVTFILDIRIPLYESIAVIFLAQLHFIELDFTQQLTIVLTATLASIGSAAVPSAGLVMLIMVLQSVGLNPLWIAIIFPVDRILDMCRTTVNVTGDATICSIIAKTEGHLSEN